MAKKPKTLLVKIKLPGKRIKILEVDRKGGWSVKDINQFVKGSQKAYPKATITTSTITK